jgi:hypothetical protein
LRTAEVPSAAERFLIVGQVGVAENYVEIQSYHMTEEELLGLARSLIRLPKAPSSHALRTSVSSGHECREHRPESDRLPGEMTATTCPSSITARAE